MFANVTDTFNLSGTIDVSGANRAACNSADEGGAGSGGSIYVVAEELIGEGNFDAGGGNAYGTNQGGAGSGGRIAVYYNESSLADMASSTVAGGDGYSTSGDGEDGTMFFIDIDDNNLWTEEGMELNVTDYADVGSFKTSAGVNFTFNNFTILGSSFRLMSTAVVDVANFTADATTLTIDADPSNHNISFVLKGGKVTTTDVFNISDTFMAKNLTFTDHNRIDFISLTSGYTLESATWDADWFYFDVLNLTLDSASEITVEGHGYSGGGTTATGSGPGGGGGDSYESGSGAGYGATGGQGYLGPAGGNDYGSALRPTDYGSGGGVSDCSDGDAGGCNSAHGGVSGGSDG